MTDTEYMGLVTRLRHLMSLNEPERGGPYAGIAAEACMNAMREAADAIVKLQAEHNHSAYMEDKAKEERNRAEARALSAESKVTALETRDLIERQAVFDAIESVRVSPYWSGIHADRICEVVHNVVAGIPDARAATSGGTGGL